VNGLVAKGSRKKNSGRLMRKSAVAETLGVCTRTVQAEIDSGRLRAIPFGSLVYVDRDQVERLLAGGGNA
jgi:excisionase family DNA binding protein